MYVVKSRSPLGQLPAFRKAPLSFLMEMAHTDLPVVRFRFAHKPVFLLMHPVLIKEALIRKSDLFHKSKPFMELEPLLGKGLLLSEKSLHKKQRLRMQPFFTPKHIENYAAVMAEVTNETLAGWEEEGERNLSKDLTELTLAIITRTMFGSHIRQGFDQVGEPLQNVMEVAMLRIHSFFKFPRSWRTPKNRLYQQAVKALDEIVQKMIDRHDGQADDLLGVLKKAVDEQGEKMDAKLLRDEVMTLFTAGHETTAAALMWTFDLLLNHPEVYAQLEEEVDKGIQVEVPTYQETKQLISVKKVLLESMRLYPPAWSFGRQPIDDVNLGSTMVKKGSTVMISPYLMHRHPRYVDYPEEFLPERFENGKLSETPDYVYLPFGEGNRVCIGQHFALLEAMIVLASFLKNYRFTKIERQLSVPEPLITLRMKNDLHVRIARK